MPEILLAITTFPERQTAERIAKTLLSEGLAACVNITETDSHYHWEGKLEQSREAMALLKTTAHAWPRLQERLLALHPYELPELIAMPVEHGSPAYLSWVAQNCLPHR